MTYEYFFKRKTEKSTPVKSNLVRLLVGVAVLSNTFAVVQKNFYNDSEPKFQEQTANYFLGCAAPSLLFAGLTNRYLGRKKYLDNLRPEFDC